MTVQIDISITLPVEPQELYEAWLDSDKHTAFTGGKARMDGRVGAAYSAWDGYIEGKILRLQPFKRIVHTWRTEEFPQGASDSYVELQFKAVEGGTKITLLHSGLPKDQVKKYLDGWQENYFKPMQEYFAK